ncbi:MAG: hypothetical protein R2777_02450 [Chitinophagales bacterium]
MTNNYVASFLDNTWLHFYLIMPSKNKAELDKYNIDNFTSNFMCLKLCFHLLNMLKAMVLNENLSDNANYKRRKSTFKANLAKQLFKNEGFYRVVNSESEAIKKLWRVLVTEFVLVVDKQGGSFIFQLKNT